MPQAGEINRAQIERLFELLKVVDFRRIESDLDQLGHKMTALSEKMTASLAQAGETSTAQNNKLVQAIERQSKNIEKLLGNGQSLIKEFSPRNLRLEPEPCFEDSPLETRQPQEEEKEQRKCDSEAEFSEGEIQVDDSVSSVQQPSVADTAEQDSVL